MIRRLIPIIALGCALAAALPAPALAQGDPPCPASIRPIAGGAGDVSSNGYDDGARGGDVKWVPGQIVVRFVAGTTTRQAACAARELGGNIIDGGVGGKGIAGVPDLALIQLDPGISVTATDRLLERSTYRNLIDSATPNTLMQEQAAPAVNDPLFPYQWGISNQRQVAANANGINVNAIGTENLPWTSILPGQRYSMRVRQAWSVLRGRTVAGLMNPNPFPRVRLSIVDDSFFAHTDLVANSDTAASRAFSDLQGDSKVVVYATQGTWRLRFGADAEGSPIESCDIAWNASAQDVAVAITKGGPALCNDPNTTTFEVSITGDGGTFSFGHGIYSTKPIPITANASEVDAALRNMVDEIDAELPGPVGVEPITAVHVLVTRATRPRVYRVTLPAATGAGLTFSGAGVTDSQGPPAATLTPVAASTVRTIPIAAEWTGATAAFTVTRAPFTGSQDLTLAAVPQEAADYIPGGVQVVRAPAGYGGWPGRQAGTGTHGQNIAGMIGAQADNGIGITGVLGKYHNVKMVGLVGMSFSNTVLATALRYASDIGSSVANVSIGGGTGADWPARGGPDPIQQSAMQAAISHVPLDSKTLYVVAASNYGGNSNAPSIRDNGPVANRTCRTYEDRNGNVVRDAQGYAICQAYQYVATNPCRPKGANVKVRPMRGGEPQDAGGTLSLLQMPDGTYDRGNLLCVGSVNWFGKLSEFTQWGRDVIDVAAPGENIIGTSANDGYDVGNGTSYAAPYVASVAAMVNTVYPAARPWLVKCAILSSATSKPLPRQDFTARPLVNYSTGDGPANFGPNGEAFTVNGMVQASEAISAAGSLLSRVAAAQNGQGTWPTCVQKRRTFAGFNLGWRNTPVAP